VRPQQSRRPRPPVGFRYEAREFARDVRQRGQLSELSPPFTIAAPADVRFAQMIEYEWLPRIRTCERNRLRELTGVDEDVVHESRSLELLERRQKPGTRKKAVRLRLHDVPDADERGSVSKLRELPLDVVSLQIDPADNAGNERIAIGQIEQKARLVKRLPRL